MTNLRRALMFALTAAVATGLALSSEAAEPSTETAATTTEAAAPAGAAIAPVGSDWPCVQRKIASLTSTQIWDGPPVEEVKGWAADPEIAKLVPYLASRRVTLEEAAGALKTFAEATAADKRDAKLVLLFAGVLAKINIDRASVLSGIERFQRRQRTRAEELQREGVEIAKLKEAANPTADAPSAETSKVLEEYDWNVRIFQERQQNLPLACEIPVQIEQRAFEIGREIRTHMSG